ncbi:peptidoglycan editing factor PgeF [soil metagenome]
MYYASARLERAGVPHAFSTRVGGVSAGPFASLNLGNPSGSEITDEADHIARNYRLLHAAIGCQDRTRCFVKQVHGCAVIDAGANADFANGRPADALTTDDASRLLAIQTADCIPILLSSDDGRCVAAIHAGWRGIIARVIDYGCRALLRMARSNRPLIAAVGPCISKLHFEVGPEVLDQFKTEFGDEVIHDARHVDLPRAAYLQLIAAGVSPDKIDTTDRCTFRDADEFFSHRRDRGITGRMASVIGPRSDSQPNP